MVIFYFYSFLECLLLLHALTFGGHQEIQKVIAFEGAFERLFRIIIEEGGNKGGIIVQDCLNIIKNLVFDNSSNQKYFRENGCFEYLRPLLRLPFTEVNVKTLNIFTRSMEILSFLLEGDDPKATKDFIVKSKLINEVIYNALAEKSPKEISFPSLSALEWIIHKHKDTQDSLLAYNFILENEDFESAVVSLCKIILYETDEIKQQKAYQNLKKFLDSNSEGQMYISSTIKAPILVSSLAEGKI